MWDFETDPDYQRDLDWADVFVREEVEPLQHVLTHALVRDEVWRALVPPLQAEVSSRSIVPSRTTATRGRGVGVRWRTSCTMRCGSCGASKRTCAACGGGRS